MSFPSLALSLDEMREHLGANTVTNGQAYFTRGRVSGVTWFAADSVLRALVDGSEPRPYIVSAYLDVDSDQAFFEGGECTCPVGLDCKHVAAVLLHLIHTVTPTRSTHWSDMLPAVNSPRTPALGLPSGYAELGLQLAPAAPAADRPESVRVLARPVRRSSRGAWVTDSISWDRLTYPGPQYEPRQLAALTELHAFYLVKSRQTRSRYYYQQGSNIDLSESVSAVLWQLLDEVFDSGVAVVHAKRSLGDISPIGHAIYETDVTVSEVGDLSVTGRTWVGDTVLDPADMAFLGTDGSGIIVWDDDADEDVAKRKFRLARFGTPVPRSMQRLATSPPLRIPAADRPTFSAQYLPALRVGAPVISSDESYREPVVIGPELHVDIECVPGARITVSGEWRYTIDDVEVLISGDRPVVEDGTRDIAGELAILAPVYEIPEFDVPQNRFPTAVFDGARVITLMEKVVPALAGIEGVHVDVHGDVPTFADVSDNITIELSTRAVPGNNDWFDLGIDVVVDGTKVPLATIIVGIANGETHVILDDGRYFDLHTPALLHLRDLVHEARELQESPDQPLRLSRFQVGLWDELMTLGVVKRQAKAWRAQVSGLLALDPGASVPPRGLHAELRGYQLEGLTWLSFIYDHGLGGILADDMGLGKTLQALALIQRARENGSLTSPFLIVAPTSVVHNWQREAARFTPDLTVVAATETHSRRGRTIADIADGADIVVTSYTVFRLDFTEFDEVRWTGLILDEAQYVKNHQSKSHQCVRRLQAPFKLAITGTPMENNVMELWSLLSITSPGLFPSPKKFTENYRRPIENEGDAAVLQQLRRRIRPLVQRRTKELVAKELPPKQEQTVEIDLHPPHRRLYDATLNRERQKVLGLLGDLDRNRFTILKSLTVLRQLSLDPSLIDPAHASIPSAKTDELIDQLVEVVAGGHRVLVFSQFTRYLGRVRDRLLDMGIEHAYLDGKTRNRGTVVEQFRSGDVPVFLISLKAGGVGLTLTEADYCFVLDPWWNPATEAQAVDRAHRIGQKKTVFVNRYVARETIEEKVMALKARKAALFAGVLDEGDAFSSALTADDIRGLIA